MGGWWQLVHGRGSRGPGSAIPSAAPEYCVKPLHCRQLSSTDPATKSEST